MDSRIETAKHISQVQKYLGKVINNLTYRSHQHDLSKLKSPEVEVLDEVTPKLAGLTYGSPEYAEQLKGMKPFLDHHYSHNDHHPEFWAKEPAEVSNGTAIMRMPLTAVLEMLCDWKAAGLRHKGGDLMRSIHINQERYGYDDTFKRLLLNTALLLGD